MKILAPNEVHPLLVATVLRKGSISAATPGSPTFTETVLPLKSIDMNVHTPCFKSILVTFCKPAVAIE